MKSQSDILQYLRDHIVGGIHVGHIQAGDRLPSIRDMAARLGKNTRTVKAAYHLLEQEGLVEVRGRSGVFATAQQIGDEINGEMARWMSAFLCEAWKRRIPLPVAADTVRRFTRSRQIRCGLVEVVSDGIVAFGHELREDWGFEVQVVPPDALASAVNVDFFAATSFFAASIHSSVEALGKPLVILTTHSSLQDAILGAINDGRLTVVALDPAFRDRMRIAYAPDDPDRIRFVLARDLDGIARIDPDEPILLTRAAATTLGREPAPMIFPHSPTLSVDTAQALASIMVQLNAKDGCRDYQGIE